MDTKCIIWGEQILEDRNKNVNNFNTDKSRVIICNIKSGGVGISLHDTIGKYPRISLISPSDSAQDIIQVLGRIHRTNGKTPVTQYILYCKKTIEEKICENMKDKIQNILLLNDGIKNAYQIDGLMDEDSNIQTENISEFDKIINCITILNLRKERLTADLGEIEKEIKSLTTAIDVICA